MSADHRPYAELGTTLPDWEAVQNDDATGFPLPPSNDTVLRWQAKNGNPPAIGEHIMMNYNGLGSAVVVGYFSEGQFLGLICTLDTPTAQGSTLAHAFGSEWRGMSGEERSYTIVLVETVTYTLTIVATDEDTASERARTVWNASDDPTQDFNGYGKGVEVESIELT